MMPSRTVAGTGPSRLGQDHRLESPPGRDVACDLREYGDWRDPSRAARVSGLRVSAGQGVLAAGLPSLPFRSWTEVFLVALLVFLVYLAGCCVWPYGACLSCAIGDISSKRGGRGRNMGSSSKRHGRCRVCRGSGERLRVGTRILGAWSNKRLPRGVWRK